MEDKDQGVLSLMSLMSLFNSFVSQPVNRSLTLTLSRSLIITLSEAVPLYDPL